MKKHITFQLVVSVIAIVVAFILGSLTSMQFDDDEEVYCAQNVCEINPERIYNFGLCTYSSLRYNCSMTQDTLCYAYPCDP